jgi:hypothetical protein
LNYLDFPAVSPGGTLPGWSKPIPEALFEVAYTTDEQVKQLLKLKGSIFQTSVANDPMQLSTLDL